MKEIELRPKDRLLTDKDGNVIGIATSRAGGFDYGPEGQSLLQPLQPGKEVVLVQSPLLKNK